VSWIDRSSGPSVSFVVFWTTKYQTTPWNVPIPISQDYFKTKPLVEFRQGQCQHHLFVVIPFGFKSPIILEHAIIKSDNFIFCTIPTGYSYWCSHLNQTTHIAQSSNHFPYIVDLGTKGYTVSRLYTQVQFPKPQTQHT
jgi:hypothetical protein